MTSEEGVLVYALIGFDIFKAGLRGGDLMSVQRKMLLQ